MTRPQVLMARKAQKTPITFMMSPVFIWGRTRVSVRTPWAAGCRNGMGSRCPQGREPVLGLAGFVFTLPPGRAGATSAPGKWAAQVGPLSPHEHR